MQTILFFLTGAGATLIFQSGSLFGPLHRRVDRRSPRLARYLKCELCLGFWVGVLLVPPWHLAGLTPPLGTGFLNLFFTGCVASLATYVIGRTVGDDGINLNL